MHNQFSYFPDPIVPLWCTPGSEERGLRIQRLFLPVAIQLQKLLDRSVPFSLSVLSEDDWGPLSTGVPFMLPAYDPEMSTNGMVMIPAIPVFEGMELLKPNTGWSQSITADEMYDAYCIAGMSCLGNAQSNTSYPTPWLRSIMNFYLMAYAAKLADSPAYPILLTWRQQWSDPINSDNMGIMELESFDFLADSMDIAQFYQYQTAFLRRAIDLCEQDNGNFYAQYRQKMSIDQQNWSEREVVRNISHFLETIGPGWVQWTERFSIATM